MNLVIAVAGAPVGGFSIAADAAGAITGTTGATAADELLDEQSDRETVIATANDRARIDANQQPPETQFGFTQFTFTRWAGFSPGRYVPGRRATVELYGWTFATGKIGWLLFRQGSRTVAAVKVGRLDDKCGDRIAKIRVPRRLQPGAYRVVLTTDRALRGPFTGRKARVTTRRSVASATSLRDQAMSHAGPLSRRDDLDALHRRAFSIQRRRRPNCLARDPNRSTEVHHVD